MTLEEIFMDYLDGLEIIDAKDKCAYNNNSIACGLAKRVRENQMAGMTIEKLIDIGSDLYTIEIRQGMRILDCYCLDDFVDKKIKITIKIEEIKK